MSARTAYLEVAPNSRRRIFRCRCGKSATYNINYRKERREVTYGPARIITRNARQTKIRLNDVSVSGVSFYIGSEFALAMRRGQEIGIKFRSGGSSVTLVILLDRRWPLSGNLCRAGAFRIV